MNDVPVVALFVAALASGFVGALIGGAFVVHSLAKGRLNVRSVELPRRLVVIDAVDVSLSLKNEDGRVVVRADHSVLATALDAEAVQSWLDDAGLVAQFKGADFKVPVRANPWQPTR